MEPSAQAVLPAKGWRRWLFILSGGLTALGGIGPPLMHTLFVIAALLRARRPAAPASRRRFAVYVLLCGLLLEAFAWVTSYLEGSPEPALLHPQLLPDLLLSIGFYAGWSLAWALLLRWFRFSLLEMFLAMGVYGVLVEQNGAVFLLGLGALPVGLILWAYVFFAYAGTVALAYVWAGGVRMGTRHHVLKYVLALLALYLFVQVTFTVWGLLVQNAGWLPPPRPIREAPFF